jgi:uncharacterized repeat protein (TIGR01451 family)
MSAAHPWAGEVLMQGHTGTSTVTLRRRNVLLAAVVLLIVAATLPSSAWALGPAFDPATPTVFVVHGTPTAQLSKAVESNGQLVFQDIGPATLEYNSIAYDTVNNYIYGVDFSTGATRGDIIQVGADGIPSDTGINLGATPDVVAAWNPTNNEVYFVTGPGGSEVLQPFNPATDTLGTPIPLSANLPPDITYSQGFFWGWGSGLISRVDPATGTVTTFPGDSSLFTGCFGAPACGGAGADWTYGNGNLGFNENQGQIYQISVTNPASATPTFKLVSVQPGPSSSNIDGAANPGLPTDLAMNKTASSQVPDGGQITYTLTVTNNGPGNSSGYVVSDTLPAALSNPTTSSTGCSISGQVLTCVSANPLNAGATSAPITVTATVPNPFTTPITNTATVTANEQDPNPTNDTGGVTTTPQADLSIVKTAAPSPAAPGTDETYTLAVKNNGPDTAQNVSVSDQLPAGVSFVSASTGCAETSGQVTCTQASLAPSATTTFTVIGHLASSLTSGVVNTATVTSSTPDPDPNNNSSTASAPLGPKADLQITKTASTGSVPAGGQVMYTLVVKNNGPSDATDATVSDALPAALSAVSAQASQGSCTTSLGITCDLGTVAAGGSAQVLVTASVAASATGSLANSATVIGGEPDPNPTNNTGASTITVTPAPQPTSDIAIVKTASHKTAHTGQKITYTLTVTNHGPDNASNVDVIDTSGLPAKVLSVNPSQGSCKAGSPIRCSLGTLADGAHATIKVVTQIKRSGTEKNSASSTSASNDPNPSNNIDGVNTTIRARLLLNKTVKPGTITTGHTATFSLRVTNPGSTSIKHVKVCDTMPRGLIYVASNPAAHRSGGRWCWSLGTIRAHHSRTVSIRGEAGLQASGKLVNHATVSAPGAAAGHAHATLSVTNTANRCGSAVDATAARSAHTSRDRQSNPVARMAC